MLERYVKQINTKNWRGGKMSELAEKMNQAVTAVDGREGKYLTFSLAEEGYGLSILKVKEIIGMLPVTLVPQTPEFVKGVINLRGKVIPVIDFRLRFGMKPIEYTERTCIIVVELKNETEKAMIGVVVDSVSEVMNIKSEEIENTPVFGANLNTDYILGMAKTEGTVKILLDIEKILNNDELALFRDPV